MKETENTASCDEKSGDIISLGTVKGKSGNIVVSIIGQIEGHYILPDNQKTTKYEHILPLLVGAEQDPNVRGILVLINTVGGDVEAGLAIAELLSGMKTPTVSLVLGGGHSIGLPIALACDRSFAVPSATMTIHPVRISGTVLGVPQAFSSLEKMQERVTGFILSHSSAKRETIERLMMNTGELTTDVGSVITGEQAVELGLIDELGGISDALSALDALGEKGWKNSPTLFS